MFLMIYMDNAATTRMSERAFEAMRPFFMEQYANAAGTYTFANASKEAVETARKQVARVIGAKSAEIFFTSGGTESDNWALKGVAQAYAAKGRHIIISAIEHHAILHSAQALQKQGWELTILPVDEYGMISVDELAAAMREDTVLVSIMAANNEIGTIQPLKAIGELCRSRGVLFHTDAVQAYAHIPLNVEEMKIDLLSASAHKFHGPKGVGFLYVRKGVRLTPFMDGGAQEKKRRAGTTNVAGIVGMGAAAEEANANMEAAMAKVAAIRDHMIARIESEIPYCRLNGHRSERLPGNVNFCFRFIEGEGMLMLLDYNGICASSGSACTSGSLDPSHVLLAIGLPHEIAHGSLRMSLSEETTMEEADKAVDALKEIIPRLRSMSPLYEDFVRNQA
ncbi:MAG: cysteine desulfurase NifS [Clostridia bacterium]|nr:cysteine desulfurase NifS [Clostridia bacterium]